MPAYYADIRGGRPIRPEHLDDLVERYRRLGIEELEPAERDHRGDARRARGRARAAGLHRACATGSRGSPRRSERALAAGADDDRRPRARAALLARCRSRSYRAQLEEALAGRAELRFVERWGTEPGFVDAARRADRVPRTTAHVVFTAHSLPARILDEGDPTRTSCSRPRGSSPSAPASTTGRSPSRASRRPASRGSAPTSSTTSTELAAHGVRDVLVCPVGFVADHLEIRWDLDTEARSGRAELGHELDGSRCRTPTRRSSRVLAGLVRRAAAVPSVHVRTGEIRVDAVSRRFRVHAHEARTLKELFVLPRPHRGRRRAGRSATSRSRSSRARRSGLDRPQRLGQDDAAAPARGDHQADDRPRRGRRARRLAARARRRLPSRLHAAARTSS